MRVSPRFHNKRSHSFESKTASTPTKVDYRAATMLKKLKSDMPEKIEASGENRTKSGRKVIKPKRLIEEM